MSLRRTLALGLFLTAKSLCATTMPPVEPMPTVEAAVLAPAALLNGAGYTVDAKVPVAGYMGQFTLRAPAGIFSANGTEMLAIRESELTAIAKASELRQTDLFAQALAASAKKTGAAIGQAVTKPVETIQGIPAGVGRFLQSAGKTASRATESATGSKSSQAGGTADAAADLLGVNEAKRRIAKQIGADPYTTNPVLAKQLDDLAGAAFAGGVSLDVALAVTTAGVATAISTTASVSNMVWDKSPVDIRSMHEQKLAAMGVGPDTVRAFVTNRWLTPTLSVPFVEQLSQISTAKGRAAVVALASTVASEGEARFMVNAVGIARGINTDKDPVVAIDLDGRILVVRTRGGRVEVPAPVDYVAWTETVKAFSERHPKAASRTIRLTGIASERARQGLKSAGWVVEEHGSR